MGELVEFANRVRGLLYIASREPHWEPSEAARYMVEVAVRRERFAKLAARLTAIVIKPRLDTLAGCFPNTSPTQAEPDGRCSCWFGYCERFPSGVSRHSGLLYTRTRQAGVFKGAARLLMTRATIRLFASAKLA